jgi:hypothetical protein
VPADSFALRAFTCLLACALAQTASAASSPAEQLIEAGHWKRARALVEAGLRERPADALNYYLLSQIRYAFGDAETPLALAEKAVALDGGVGKYHRQLAEVTGVMAQRANPLRLVALARRFHKELDAALALDPRDALALRDLMEFYLRAPGLIGGDARRAAETADRIAAIDAEEGWLARERLARYRKDRGAAAATLAAGARAIPSSYRLQAAAAEARLAAPRDLASAEIYARRALALDPSRAAAHAALARVLAYRGDRTGLQAVLAVAEAAVPDDLTPSLRAAEALIETGRDLDFAASLLRRYASAEPEGDAPTRADALRKLRAIAAPR